MQRRRLMERRRGRVMIRTAAAVAVGVASAWPGGDAVAQSRKDYARAMAETHTRIVGGRPAAAGAWPWQVALVRPDRDNDEGTVLRRRPDLGGVGAHRRPLRRPALLRPRGSGAGGDQRPEAGRTPVEGGRNRPSSGVGQLDDGERHRPDPIAGPGPVRPRQDRRVARGRAVAGAGRRGHRQRLGPPSPDP